jgi:hypothetical protein
MLAVTERILSASTSRAVLMLRHSCELSEPPPSSNMQILNLLTPEMRASLLWEMPSASRRDRSLIINHNCCGGRARFVVSREVSGSLGKD